MIREDELLELFEKENIKAIKAMTDLDYKKFVLLQSESVEELIEFAKDNSINTIFYEYIYYHEGDYKFDLEEVKLDVDRDIFKIIKKDIISHNKKVENLDFSKARVFNTYLIYQGQKIGILVYDSWIKELDYEILKTEDQLEKIMEKYEDKLFEIVQKERAILDKIKIEFEDILINDEEFLCCTNQKMRSYYMNNIIDNKKYKEYTSLFMRGMYIDRNSLWVFIESVWKKYKVIEKAQKQSM